MRVNYHTHTAYCGHAQGSVADYTREALDKGLEKLGFSDHLPFPGNPYGSRMPFSDLDAYVEDVRKQADLYKGEMEIRCGFEGEYVRGKESYYEKLLTSHKSDYFLLGQHFFLDRNGVMHNTYELAGTEEYLLYVDSVLEGMDTGYFTAVAHPDLIFFNAFAWDENCDRACDRLVEMAVKKNLLLEYNANGYRRGICHFPDGDRYQYPHEKLWKRVAEAGVRVVIGSDCHQPELMYDEAVVKAYQDAKERGLNVVTDIWEE